MRNSKRIKIVAGGTAILFGTGVAFAAWTSTGTGDGSVTAGTEVDLTVAQVAPVTGLYPTGSKDIQITVTNNNPYPVSVTSVTPGTMLATTGLGNCTAANSLVAFPSVATTGQYLAANGGFHTYTLSVTMGADSDHDCQGATFTAPYTASADSTAVTP